MKEIISSFCSVCGLPLIKTKQKLSITEIYECKNRHNVHFIVSENEKNILSVCPICFSPTYIGHFPFFGRSKVVCCSDFNCLGYQLSCVNEPSQMYDLSHSFSKFNIFHMLSYPVLYVAMKNKKNKWALQVSFSTNRSITKGLRESHHPTLVNHIRQVINNKI